MRPAFLHALGLQLLEPPPASAAALQALSPAPPHSAPAAPLLPPRAAAAASIARRWLTALLRPHLVPGPEVPFLAFPAEGGRADVVRAVWGPPHASIQTAQTRYLIALVVHRDVDSAEPAERRAEAAATALFKTTALFPFARLGEDDTGVFGQRDLKRAPAYDPSPNWIDSMHFWAKGTRMGLLLLRASGGATREFIGADENVNRVWFDLAP